MVAVFLLSLPMTLAIISDSSALIRPKRHFSSQNLQRHTRYKRQAYPYSYGNTAQSYGYNYLQYSANYPYYGSFANYYSMQPSYGGTYPAQYSQYQQYSPYNNYNNCYRYSCNQRLEGGGFGMDGWGNRYVMFGDFKLYLTCKARGCPGE